MKSDRDLQDLLARELRQAPAPPNLWIRVHAEINAVANREPQSRQSYSARWAWASAAAVIVVLVLIPSEWIKEISPAHLLPGVSKDHALDLQGYLAPVQSATDATSIPAIYRAPSNFSTIAATGVPLSLGQYNVAVQRQGKVDGERVKQVVLSSPDDTAAVFFASPKVRLTAGSNHWVADNLEGLACQRLNCPRVRTVQFPCAPEVCVIVCKACSEKVLLSLMEQVLARAPEFR